MGHYSYYVDWYSIGRYCIPRPLVACFCSTRYIAYLLQVRLLWLVESKTFLVVFSLLIVNIFDTIGTLMGLAEKTGIVREDGSIPHVSEAMMSDAIGTTCGGYAW